MVSETLLLVLGLVMHAAGVELNYFGRVFSRPFLDPPLWSTAEALPASDLYASLEEPRESVVAFYARVREFADATIAALSGDAPGVVMLQQVLVQVSIELRRHAGHHARLEKIAVAAGRALRG